MNYNLLVPLLIAVLAWAFILTWLPKKKKQEKMKRQQLLAQIKEQLPIPSFKELLQTLEALNYDPSWCYFKTDTFESEQEACEHFVYKYFLLSNEEINWLKQ